MTNKFLASNIEQPVTHLLKQWGELSHDVAIELPPMLLMQQAMLGKDQTYHVAKRLAANSIVENGLLQLAERLPTHAAVLQQRFLNKQTRDEVATLLMLSSNQIKHLQKEALAELFETIAEMENSQLTSQRNQLLRHIPTARYSSLFGIQSVQHDLLNRLLDSTTHALVVSGIGGIGKTSLTNSTVRLAIEHNRFTDVVWIDVDYEESLGSNVAFSGSPSELAQRVLQGLSDQDVSSNSWERSQRLRELMRAQPILIVVDNLESTAAVEHVMRYFKDLLNPSKLLLTSRVVPAGASQLFNLDVPELEAKDSAELMRHYAATIACQDVINASEADLTNLYSRVGGNPLALRLIVSLLVYLSINDVLDDLLSVQGRDITELYTKIYQRIWNAISEDARSVLQQMPLAAGPGFPKSHLADLCSLSIPQLNDAIAELVRHSLLDPRGNIRNRHYSIHRLTETFLQTSINQWMLIEQ